LDAVETSPGTLPHTGGVSRIRLGIVPECGAAMKKVLAVDDHVQIVRLIQVNLQRDFTVITAGDGVEGMEKARQERPDLILLDVVMPRKDGFAMLRELQEDPELRKIPVIMLTVKAQNADIVRGLHEGAQYYLPKPFHPHELNALVKRVISGEPPEAEE
jgi:DNA-binding response OmpR family regulator